MNLDRAGIALVICAPSGAGKTTLIKRLMAEMPGFCFSVSCTTRAPRAGEVEGRDYFFLDREEFITRRNNGFFAEWAEVHGNFYGTPLEHTEKVLASGQDLLFDIDVQGAAQLKKSLPGAYFVFILPPSRTVLRQRLANRSTETPESLEKRLNNAGKEIREAFWFDACVVNDDLAKAFAELQSVVCAARLSAWCRAKSIETLLGDWEDA